MITRERHTRVKRNENCYAQQVTIILLQFPFKIRRYGIGIAIYMAHMNYVIAVFRYFHSDQVCVSLYKSEK